MSKLHIKLNIQRFAVNVTTHSLTETGYNASTGKSSVRYQVAIQTTGDSYNINNQTGTFVIDGVTYTNVYKLPKNSTTIVFDQTVDVSNDGTGTRVVSASYRCPTTPAYGTQTGSTSVTLIARYPTSNQSIASKTETSITMNWSSNTTINYLWYSINNGASWVAVGNPNTTSGSYTITGLSAGTPYNIKTRVRSAASNLTTDSGTSTQSTYYYPHCTSAPNFYIGNTLTLGLYNPLSRSINVYLIDKNNVEYGPHAVSSTSISGFTYASLQQGLYSSLGVTGKSAQYRVKVVYGNSVATANGGNYQVSDDYCRPTLQSYQIYDVNPKTLALTNNNNRQVLNYSTVRIESTFNPSNSNDLVSTIISRRVDDTTYTTEYIDIEKANKSSFNVRATNSRQILSNSRTISFTDIVNYFPPTITGEFTRPIQTGNRIAVSFNGSYFNNYFDAEEQNLNEITIKWYVRINENEEWTYGGTFVKDTDYTISNNTFTTGYSEKDITCPATISGGEWDYMTKYYFKLEVTDLLYDSNEPIEYEQYLVIATPYYSWWRTNGENYLDVLGTLMIKGQPVLEYEIVDEWND